MNNKVIETLFRVVEDTKTTSNEFIIETKSLRDATKWLEKINNDSFLKCHLEKITIIKEVI